MNRKKILIIISIILLIILFSFSCFYIFYRYRYKINKFKYLGGTITKKDIENNINENYINTITVYERINEARAFEYVYPIENIFNKLNNFRLSIDNLHDSKQYARVNSFKDYFYFVKIDTSYVKGFKVENFKKINELEQCIAKHIDEPNFQSFFNNLGGYTKKISKNMANEILTNCSNEIQTYLDGIKIEDQIIRLQDDLHELRTIIFDEKIFTIYKNCVYPMLDTSDAFNIMRKTFFKMRREFCDSLITKKSTLLQSYHTKMKKDNNMFVINPFIPECYVLNKIIDKLLLVCESDKLKEQNLVTIVYKTEIVEGTKTYYSRDDMLDIELNPTKQSITNNHSITLTCNVGDKFIIFKPITHDTWNDVSKFEDAYVRQVFNIISTLTINCGGRLWLLEKRSKDTYNKRQQGMLDIYKIIINNPVNHDSIVKSCFGIVRSDEKRCQIINELTSVEPIDIVKSKVNDDDYYVIVFLNGKHIAMYLKYNDYFNIKSQFINPFTGRKKSPYPYKIISDISDIIQNIQYHFKDIMDTRDGNLQDIIVPVIRRSLEVGGDKFIKTYLYQNITNITGSPYNIDFITKETEEIKKIEKIEKIEETEETEETEEIEEVKEVEEVEEVEEVKEVKEIKETEDKKIITGVNPCLKFYIDYNHKLHIKSTNNQTKIYVPLKYDDIEKKYLVDMDYIGDETKKIWYGQKISDVHLANNAGGSGVNIMYPTNHIIINNFTDEIEKKKIPRYMLKQQTTSSTQTNPTIPMAPMPSTNPLFQIIQTMFPFK